MTVQRQPDPAPATLAKYGLTLKQWKAMYQKQKGMCPICSPRIVPRLVIDHDHKPGWKRMSAAERVKHVRGLLCDMCNHYILTRFATPKRHRNAASYLENHERRL